MTQRIVFCFIVLGLLVGFTPRARAAPITWAFEGTVRYVNVGDASALAGSLGVSVGASATGQLVYESTTPDLVPGSGTYEGAVTGFGVTIGSYTTGQLEPQTLNAFYVRVRGVNPFDLQIANGSYPGDPLFPSGLLELSLIADTPGVIPDSALPGAPPALSALRPFSIDDWTTIGFGTGLWLFGDLPSSELGGVLVEFSRLELVAEPEVFALLGFASLAIALRRMKER